MKSFLGKIAVITGGGAGMGREMARQLFAEGCRVAICDISSKAATETKRICETAGSPEGAEMLAFTADVSKEKDLIAFRESIVSEFKTDIIHLLFNNAGVGGGDSIIANTREEWERTFNIDFFGVYYSVRTFLPLLLNAPEGHVVNTASMYGFWAAAGPSLPQSAYCTAKFAVKGFTESLIEDFRANAPHLKCSVVMPGHIGTQIWANTLGDTGPEEENARAFVREAPTSSEQAAKIILDGVRSERWRILVGPDAEAADVAIRANPEDAYQAETFKKYGVQFYNRMIGLT